MKLALILEVLKAIPQVLKLIKTMWDSLQEWRENKLIEETKKAVVDGDNKKVEENIGSPNAGAPVDLPGVVSRPKKRN